jgi:hypothetical protein
MVMPMGWPSSGAITGLRALGSVSEQQSDGVVGEQIGKKDCP